MKRDIRDWLRQREQKTIGDAMLWIGIVLFILSMLPMLRR